MKKYLLVSSVLLSFLLSGCFATHSGYLNNSASLSQANFKYVKRSISGESIATTVLGIGGLGRQAMVDEAKSDMLRGVNLKSNQTIANSTVSWKNSFYLGLFITNKCTVTADIIEFVKEGEEVADNSIVPVVQTKVEPIAVVVPIGIVPVPVVTPVVVPVKVEEPKTTNSFTSIKGTKWISEGSERDIIFSFERKAYLSLDYKKKDVSRKVGSFKYSYNADVLYLISNDKKKVKSEISISEDQFTYNGKKFIKE